MNKRLVGVTTSVLLLGGIVAGCSDSDTEYYPSSDPATEAPKKQKSEPKPESPEGDLPDLTGMDLQYAQDSAQAEGFYALMEEDGSGLGRIPLWDRNWQVCSQNPGPGTYSTDKTVTFTVVRLEESC